MTERQIEDMCRRRYQNFEAVIAVAQDRDIIEKHIRSLQTELVEPAVFGDRVF